MAFRVSFRLGVFFVDGFEPWPRPRPRPWPAMAVAMACDSAEQKHFALRAKRLSDAFKVQLFKRLVFNKFF